MDMNNSLNSKLQPSGPVLSLMRSKLEHQVQTEGHRRQQQMHRTTREETKAGTMPRIREHHWLAQVHSLSLKNLTAVPKE